MTILAGYLPNAQGRAVLRAALAEAKLRDTAVILLNSPRRGAAVDAHLTDEDTERELLAEAAVAGVSASVSHLAHDADLAEAFADLAERSGAELIVVGIRRRSPVGKLIMGSDAQRIILASTVPVLCVKAD